jgi:hypothetical protein
LIDLAGYHFFFPGEPLAVGKNRAADGPLVKNIPRPRTGFAHPTRRGSELRFEAGHRARR